MKTLYIECNMGAAGDMLMAALCELLPDPDAFIDRMNGLGLPGVHVARRRVEKCGIMGTHIDVTVHGEEEHSHDDHGHEHHHHHHHDHSHPADIRAIIDGLPVSGAVKKSAAEVYGAIARAESEVHGVPVEEIHFHEVGALDAVADVVGVCLLMEHLTPDRVVVSPVHVGFGEVHCAHGTLPVPAPATARLLEGVPVYGGRVRGELCTPTGAALLTHFADAFGPMPPMRVAQTGYGMGTKDFEWVNCLRAMLGEAEDAAPEVCELQCNLDDMTGEALAFAAEALLAAGALDAWCQPLMMKKGRPGYALCCLCEAPEEARFAQLMLRHTTTLGVRCRALRRYTLNREAAARETPWGTVRTKRSRGYGIAREKLEFDDVAAIARREGLTAAEVMEKLNHHDTSPSDLR